MKSLLSRKTLAERWDMSIKSIERYEFDGIITRVNGLPSARYSLEEILKIENNGEVNPLSPLERRRLESKIKKLENELQAYKGTLYTIKELIG